MTCGAGSPLLEGTARSSEILCYYGTFPRRAISVPNV